MNDYSTHQCSSPLLLLVSERGALGGALHQCEAADSRVPDHSGRDHGGVVVVREDECVEYVS